MFEKMRAGPPIIESLFFAVFLSGVVLLLKVFVVETGWSTLFQQMAMVAGGVLLFGDVLDGATIARRGAARVSRASLMFAVAIGSFWSWAMIVMQWTPKSAGLHGDLIGHFALWIVAGAGFGAVMTLVWKDTKGTDARMQFYDLDRPLTRTPSGRLFYYGAPVVGVVFIALAMIWPPAQGWSIAHLWFALLLIWTSAPLYPASNGRLATTPRPYGVVLVLIGLLAD